MRVRSEERTVFGKCVRELCWQCSLVVFWNPARAEPDLGFRPLLAKLQEQQPDLGAATKEVREALKVLNAESEADHNRPRGHPF